MPRVDRARTQRSDARNWTLPACQHNVARVTTIRGVVEGIGRPVIGFVESIGEVTVLTARAFFGSFRPPYRPRQYFLAMEDVGVGSLFIVLLTGLFAGAVFSLQSVSAFRMFNAESLVGTTVALTLARELGPVLTGLMVAGRSGSAMATTLGTMRVTEQIDAMEVMAVDPVHYLISPRLIGTMLVMPLLNTLFVYVGMLGAYLVAVVLMRVDPGIFMLNIKEIVDPMDLVMGAIKAATFGVAIAAIGCSQGFNASGGARGVGEATTTAVVMSSVAILVLNYFLTAVMFA